MRLTKLADDSMGLNFKVSAPAVPSTAGAGGATPPSAPEAAASNGAGPVDTFQAAAPGAPASSPAMADANRVVALGLQDPGAAAALLRERLQSNPDPAYRGALTLAVKSGAPQVFDLAVRIAKISDGLKQLDADHRREREGTLNSVGGWLVDRFSGEGAKFDQETRTVDQAFAQARSAGTLDEATVCRLEAELKQAQKDDHGYQSDKANVASTAADVAATAAATISVLATAGTDLPVLAAIGIIGGSTAAATVGTKAVVENRDYTLQAAAKDGAVSFLGAAVGGAFSRVGALSELGAGVASRMGVPGSVLVSGAVTGTAMGGITGGISGALDDNTWKDGPDQGLLRIAKATAIGAIAGGVVGAGSGVVGRALSERLRHDGSDGKALLANQGLLGLVRHLAVDQGENKLQASVARGVATRLTRGTIKQDIQADLEKDKPQPAPRPSPAAADEGRTRKPAEDLSQLEAEVLGSQPA